MNSCYVNGGVVITKYTGARGKSGSNDASAEFCGYVRNLLDDAGVVWQTGELGKVDAGGGGTVAKYIASLAVVVAGKVDAIILTGGIAHSRDIVRNITERISFIAPVEVYAGENELESLAENGYGILNGEFEVREYRNIVE